LRDAVNDHGRVCWKPAEAPSVPDPRAAARPGARPRRG